MSNRMTQKQQLDLAYKCGGGMMMCIDFILHWATPRDLEQLKQLIDQEV